ncbi:MAG: hypothetical protein AAFR96_10980 [Planctomycetota bacterium]
MPLMLLRTCFLAIVGVAWNIVLAGHARAQTQDWLDLSRPLDEAICFTLYTTHNGTLKLTAQLYPLADDIGRDAHLQVERAGEWHTIARTTIDDSAYGGPLGDLGRWTAHFRVDEWDPPRDHAFRVVAADGCASYEGTIRRDPVDKAEIVVAVLSCNSNEDRGPREDVVRGVESHDPDLLFFAGDQVYDHRHHLQSWLAFGRQFGELTRHRPTVTIPDDHDVGQGNLWGEGGVRSHRPGGDDGGYLRDPRYVNSVQQAQTWHLPDAVDPKPVSRNIGVYFTSLRVGRVDFAIIEDRKFKTGPLGAVPELSRKPGRPDLVTVGESFDPQRADVPEARLLGDRQLGFLRRWGQDWSGSDMKAVLSQTVFAHIGQRSGPWVGPGGPSFDADAGDVYVMDFDSNGWPQRGRNAALEEIRRAFAVMLCGDQHLPAVVHLGVNAPRDAGVAFAAPAIMNVWARRWQPTTPRISGDDADTHIGDFVDGFGNYVSMLAYANATREPERDQPETLGGLAEGFGIARFDVDRRTITLECWPRQDLSIGARVTQYPGWPIVVTQSEQYGREPIGFLPTINVTGTDRPVVQVVHEASGELLYTKRWNSSRVRAPAFVLGGHTVRVGEQPGAMIELTNILCSTDAAAGEISIDLHDTMDPWPIDAARPEGAVR